MITGLTVWKFQGDYFALNNIDQKVLLLLLQKNKFNPKTN